MGKRIYVGNLPFTTSENDVKELFSAHGEVVSVNIITDRETGRSRGFGFVEMADEAGDSAISALDNTEFNGRKLHVNEARGKTQRNNKY